jgi:hypothetical protein
MDMKEWDDEARFEQASTMFGETTPSVNEQSLSPEANPVEFSIESPELAATHNPTQPMVDAPDPDLMGMILDGVETIEHPSGSGHLWTRDDPMDSWSSKV